MNIYFSENVKRFRKERDLTQEALADFLGVSFQTISKWERGESYPDISFLPVIAEFFSVSTDALLGVDKSRNENEILRNIEEYDNLTDLKRKHEIIVEATEKFPNDFRLQLRRMWDLAFNHNGEDYKEQLPKIKTIYSNIQNNCKIDSIRICSKRYLAAYYSTISEYENSGITFDDCEKIIDEMPYMRDGQEFLRSYLFPHGTDEQKNYSMEAVEEAIGLLCAGLAHLFGVTDETNDIDMLITARETEINMLNSFYNDGNYGTAWRNIIYACGYVGYLYVKKGDLEKGLEYFTKEAELAKRFDSLDRITVMHSLFFEGKEFDKHTLGSTFVASSSVKTLLEEKYPLSDEFKAMPEFKEIISMLN